jgi:hemolysin activation/secretion protein
VLLGFCTMAGAQTAPAAQTTDAGRVYDSLQKRGPQTQPAIVPDVKLQPNVAAPSDTLGAATQLEVKQFRVEGATLLAQPRLELVVKPFAGRTLTVSQLTGKQAICLCRRWCCPSLLQMGLSPSRCARGA